MHWAFILGIVIFIVASVVLILIILAQRPQGGGLASAFGGAGGGGSDTAFGGRTGDVLTLATIGAFVGYLLIAIFLNIMDNRLLAQDQAEVLEAEVDPAASVPTEALETIPPSAIPTTSGNTISVPSSEVTAPLPPEGSTENDLPGQE